MLVAPHYMIEISLCVNFKIFTNVGIFLHRKCIFMTKKRQMFPIIVKRLNTGSDK